MPDQDFTNREIVLMFEQIKAELSHIKEQTTKTNGRLTRAEEKIEQHGSFQTKVLTIWGVLVAGVTVLVNKIL